MTIALLRPEKFRILRSFGFAFVAACALSLLATAQAADAKLTGDLAKSIRAGDLDGVKEAVQAGADLNALDERKMPPIGAAALLGKVDIVTYLAEKGADVNRNDGFGYTPLMCAAQRGQAGAVRALLRHGADPALKGNNGGDALTYAQPKGPADPLFEEKTSVMKILRDAIAAKGNTPAATAANVPVVAAATPAAAAPPATPATTALAPVAPPGAQAPLQPVEHSALVVKNPDGSLGVGRKEGKPVDGLKLSVHDRNEGSPSLTVAPDGSIHAAFNETHGPPYATAIYHRMSTDGGKTWSDSKNLSEDQPDINVGRCLVIADAASRVYVIWRAGLGKNFQAPLELTTGGSCNLVYRVLQGGRWSRIIPINPPGSTESQNDGSLSFYAALDPAGRVNVAWNIFPDKWHDELVDIRSGGPTTYRFHLNGIGSGLVFQTTLDGANASPPREALMTPITGNKADTAHQPESNGLDTMNGWFDGADDPVFVARVTSTTDPAIHNKYRYQLFEHGKPGAFLDLPDLSFHSWSDVPTLLTDAEGRRHLIVLYPAGEHPSVRDYLVGSDDEPAVIRQTVGPNSILHSMQAYQGPGGRMVVIMQMNDSGENGEGDDFVSVSTGGGKWSPPVNVTNNQSRRTWAARIINPVSNVAISHTYSAGPAAAAFDREGHLLVLMILNEQSLFGNQAGLLYTSGSSSKPTMQFLKF